MIKKLWEVLADKFGRKGRTGLVAGAAGIVVVTAIAGYWLLRPENQVLFADLTPQDMAAMTAELDRQKIPYALSDQGGSGGAILVEKSEVYKTRIKLMGKDLPLHGQVGFELFNNSDFGMTEFAQKINYQRALQGELTRTILSLAEIRDTRVLLALPEQGLFKQAGSKPKASVTVTMKAGQRLRNEQVTGIQRLVSAAVPGILTQDVTIVDQSGVALTRVGDAEGEALGGSGAFRLDLKKDTEAYLSHKALQVLERALGPGQALASIDVTLDMDRVQSNTDEVLGAPGKPEGGGVAGVIVRDRQTTRDGEAPLNGRSADPAGRAGGGSNQSETEYAVGHRVEQVISQPGSIRRIQVAVVVGKSLTTDQQEQLRNTVAASVGASLERGDSVVIQALDGLAERGGGPLGRVTPSTGGGPASEGPLSAPMDPSNPPPLRASVAWASALGPLGLILCSGFLIWLLVRRGAGTPQPAALTDDERRVALARVQAWMGGGQ